MWKYILGAVLTGLLSGAVRAEQILPDVLPTAPVLIEIPTGANTVGIGTGMLLSESNRVFLVTAAHVVFNMDSTNRLELLNPFATLTVYDRWLTNVVRITMDFGTLRNEGHVRRHPSHDVAVIWVGERRESTNAAGGIALYHCATSRKDGLQIVTFGSTVCTRLKDIQCGADVYILGYPTELLNNLTRREVDISRPLIRRGIVSQLNQITGKVIIDSGVYGGNSGGPTFVVEHVGLGVTSFKLAGLITQFVPVFTRTAPQIGVTNNCLVNSGYGVVEPIDYALELMRQ